MNEVLIVVIVIISVLFAGICDILYAVSEENMGMVVDKKVVIDEVDARAIDFTECIHPIMYAKQGLEFERMLVYVQNSKGEVYCADCGKTRFYETGAYDIVNFVVKKGKFTGINWIIKILE